MRTYNIPEIPDVIETLKMLSNNEVWKARLEEMKALEDELKTQIAAHTQYADIDEALSQARGKLTEAAIIRKQADDYAAAVKAQADKEYVASSERANRLMDEVSAEKKAADNYDNELAKRATELDARANDLQVKLSEVEKIRAQLTTQLAEATKIRQTYEEKLKQFQAVAAA